MHRPPYARRRGFTLVEIMVVVTVTAFLAGIVLLYNASTREQIALFTERVKLTQVVLRAKSLAIATYRDASAPCGYGVAFDIPAGTYTLMQYATTDCSPTAALDLTALQPVPNETFTLTPPLQFDQASSSLSYVIFIPPDPRTFLAGADGSALSQANGNVIVKTADGNYHENISVNTAGQVTF